jgi:hypothetical protein
MHNCKLTRNSFIDLALGELPAARSKQLLAELNDCPVCRPEYEALTSTLHVSHEALRSGLPREEFWPGYRTRLRSKLLASPAQVENIGEGHYSRAFPLPTSLRSQLWLALRTMASSSVRVPVPAMLALLMVFGAFFWVMRTRGQGKASSLPPVVFAETKTVEVPVIQEKVITRVVYVEKKSRRGANQSAIPGATNNVAAAGVDPSRSAALSLVGFKPTDEVKLTIIKGGYKDQK